MLNKILERFSQEINNEENIIAIERKVVDPLMTHIYNRLKKYIFRVLMMYYLIIILLLVIIFCLMKRK